MALKNIAIFLLLTSLIATINTKPAVPEWNIPEPKAASVPEADLGDLVMEQKCPPPCRMKADAMMRDQCEPPGC